MIFIFAEDSRTARWNSSKEKRRKKIIKLQAKINKSGNRMWWLYFWVALLSKINKYT